MGKTNNLDGEDRSSIHEYCDFLSAIFGQFRNNLLTKASSVILFGAGSFGREICIALRLHGVNPVCFCDNDPSRIGQTHCGLPIISVSELSRKKSSLIIVASIPFHNDIEQQLINLGVARDRIFSIPKNCFTIIQYCMNDIVFKNKPRSQDQVDVINESKKALLASDLEVSCHFAEMALSKNSRLSEPYLILGMIADLSGRDQKALEFYRAFFRYGNIHQNEKLRSRIFELLSTLKSRRLPEWYSQKTCFLNNSHNLAIYDIGDFSYYLGDKDSILALAHNVESALSIGKYCSIATGLTILLSNGGHDQFSISSYPIYHMMVSDSYEYNSLDPTKGDVIVGHDVWIGANSTILSGVKIGNGAVVGANSVVTKDVSDYTVVAGNPAVVKYQRFDDETIKILLRIRWWDWPYEKVMENMPLLNDRNRISEFLRIHGQDE